MGLGYVYMDLPYGNKKERMEPESALCWKSEQGRQGLWLYGADKVTLAIKSLHFHQKRLCRTVEVAPSYRGTNETFFSSSFFFLKRRVKLQLVQRTHQRRKRMQCARLLLLLASFN